MAEVPQRSENKGESQSSVVGLNFHQVQKRHYSKMEIMHAPFGRGHIVEAADGALEAACPQRVRKFKKVPAKKLVKSNKSTKKIREIAFLVVLKHFPVQKMIFGHICNCRKWNLVKKKLVKLIYFDLPFSKQYN